MAYVFSWMVVIDNARALVAFKAIILHPYNADTIADGFTLDHSIINNTNNIRVKFPPNRIQMLKVT